MRLREVRYKVWYKIRPNGACAMNAIGEALAYLISGTAALAAAIHAKGSLMRTLHMNAELDRFELV